MTYHLIEPLPESTRQLLRHNQHAGLLLDKYAQSWDPTGQLDKLSQAVQGPTIEEVVRLTREAPGAFYRDLFERRRSTLASLDAWLLEARTVGPLTLHLARASALENAGICMHRVYGFTYLPGTSVKGMTRAYAETVWFPAQFVMNDRGEPANDAEATRATDAWRHVECVFGYSPGSDRDKPWRPRAIPQHAPDDAAAVGGVVFHDAWPLTWPALVKDILNCHHPKYYQQAEPPGDWEDPIPVYFLAVAAGETFQFAVSPRGDAAPATLILASEWLAGALVLQGAGAKTNSGYGSFEITSPPAQAPTVATEAESAWRNAQTHKRVAEVAGILTLVTPGFFAGANQYGEPARVGCDLRPATLRGMLRWWWRTLHVGFLDAKTLSNLEGTIWGDTEAGGVVRVAIEPTSERIAEEYDFKNRFDPKPEIKRRHALGDRPNQKTTQGLFYASYGMDDGKDALHRFFLSPGATWSVRLLARPSHRNGFTLTADDVREQAEAALWLLCHFGACGAKSRKGFGSLNLQTDRARIDTVEQCQFLAAAARQKLGLGNRFQNTLAESAALGEPNRNWCSQFEVEVRTNDAWQLMDHIGFAYQAVAQQFAHKDEKVSLGLPRQIHGPRRERLRNQTDWQPPKTLRSLRRGASRYASPVSIHVAPLKDGFLVRVVAFPAAFLPNLAESRAFLRGFLDKFKVELERDLKKSPPAGGTQTVPTAQSQSGPSLPAVDEQVETELLPERTKKGGWRAQHLATGIAGVVFNSQDVPADATPGKRIHLIVKSANSRQIDFFYPSEEVMQQRQRRQAKQQNQGRGGKRPRR